ncbi:unnamed protein product [Dovyalis caffra]|uniref:Uncharacterized protein n=1 Tax=Dovyalis caffra TaxID=77055 RepID=A0AAV1RVU8_9ROSI|nr:unnamed protein product [Dovyalis caffra]
MLVYWIPETPDTLPANASHTVGIGAFVMNDNRKPFSCGQPLVGGGGGGERGGGLPVLIFDLSGICELSGQILLEKSIHIGTVKSPTR